MLLPYRAKNPPDHFPFVTIGLIALNTLIFALTSQYFLIIQRPVVANYAVSHENLTLWRLITAMFLHAHLLHLAGNMLFLWIFGASVEGRVRPIPYLAIYFVAGLTGGILQDLIWGAAHPNVPSLGASGAIMGVAGAYLYLFPYSTICVFWRLTVFYGGVVEWQARYVVFLFGSKDGVGHLAHLGGFATGFLYAFLLRSRRDSVDVSNIQAVRAEMKDYALLSLTELETLLQTPTEDMHLVLAYCEKAALFTSGRTEHCLAVLNHYGQTLIERADLNRLAQILLQLPVTVGGMPPVFYLRLASRLEQIASNELACQIYRRVYDLYPTAPDTEMALFRLGQLMERVYANHPYAHAIYAEMLRLFPNGQMALQARRALQQA